MYQARLARLNAEDQEPTGMYVGTCTYLDYLTTIVAASMRFQVLKAPPTPSPRRSNLPVLRTTKRLDTNKEYDVSFTPLVWYVAAL